jgi:hypothetical protein
VGDVARIGEMRNLSNIFDWETGSGGDHMEIVAVDVNER